jgi:hypothetical protein
MNAAPEDSHPNVKWLGYAGLIPQLFFVLYTATGPENLWVGQAAGFGYAALIFSFLGGAWWGIGLMMPKPPPWLFFFAVVPSLIAFVAYLPWIWGLEWPLPSLVLLGLCLLASPLVDRALAPLVATPVGWLRLRLHLSAGLGLLTLAICLF